jgi:hypothetical protein
MPDPWEPACALRRPLPRSHHRIAARYDLNPLRMLPSTRVRRSKPGAPLLPDIGAFHAVPFPNVGDAVDFCQRLVPHVVPRTGGLGENESRAVVWFHVPSRSQRSTQDGCLLFLSEGALRAAQLCGLGCTSRSVIARRFLPDSSVLVFGEDGPPPAPTRPAIAAHRDDAPSRRRSVRDSELAEADAILR